VERKNPHLYRLIGVIDMAQKARGYQETITDDQLINIIDSGVMNSVGHFLSSSDLTRERIKATYEYAGLAKDHLAPQGVSSIVSSDTTEVVEAYSAIISELMFENQKLARFLPYSTSPAALMSSQQASDVVNYCIFKKNDGWRIFNTWVKSALLWKTAVIRWDYCEEYDYRFEEYESINQVALDELLADDNVEIVGDLLIENDFNLEEAVYKDVRIKRKVDKSGVKLEVVPPEDFRIDRDASSVEDATFIAIQRDMTRSEIRKQWPDVADQVGDWDRLGTSMGQSFDAYNEERSVRKEVTGQEHTDPFSTSSSLFGTEANTEVSVTESWFRVDRDNDGIAELKHFITVGDQILYEEDIDMVPLAAICPFEVPHEFYGLSMADMVRSSTLASTAIMRGFVENTYLTNYSPKLADPNVVDFSALQNMKPKQLIATNGNPAAAVQSMPPEAMAAGTVPLLEFLQLHKEQATGMSKAAQGLNDALYVSGNSETKVSQVQSAAQKRIQHIVRRFAETGFKRCILGVYHLMRQNMRETIYTTPHSAGVYNSVDVSKLPETLDVEVNINVGENSNESRLQKVTNIGQQILPALQAAGQGMAVKPEAGLALAYESIQAMGLDPTKYLRDYEDPAFQQEAQTAMAQQQQQAQVEQQLAQRTQETQMALNEANVRYTQVQADNSLQDNTKQLAVALDKSNQEWSKLALEAAKDGMSLPPRPDFEELFQLAMAGIQAMSNNLPVSPASAAAPPEEDEAAMMQAMMEQGQI
jgi:hypothetical protein